MVMPLLRPEQVSRLSAWFPVCVKSDTSMVLSFILGRCATHILLVASSAAIGASVLVRGVGYIGAPRSIVMNGALGRRVHGTPHPGTFFLRLSWLSLRSSLTERQSSS